MNSFWQGLCPVYLGMFLSLCWIVYWIWDHNYAAIITMLLIHAWGFLMYAVGRDSKERESDGSWSSN